jgi:geranylgeranyl pyrophosphate synthase
MAQILTKVRDPQGLVAGLARDTKLPEPLRSHITTTNETVGPLLREAVTPLASRNTQLRDSLETALLSKRDYDRAWFVRLGFESVSEDWRRASHALAAAELSYSSIVILDDIVDKGATRFLKPCLYRTAGTDTAIYVAEMLRALVTVELLRAFEDLNTSPEIRHEILQRNERTLCDINYGQYLDVSWAGRDPAAFTDDDYLGLVHFTTGVDIANCLTTGALLAGGGHELLPTLERIGALIGVLLQVRDDLLDYAPSPQDIDKTPGCDFARLRMKLPYLVAYRNADEAGRKLLGSAARGSDRHNWENVRQLVLTTPTVSYVVDLMKVLRSDLNIAIQSTGVRSDSRSLLQGFTDEILSGG